MYGDVVYNRSIREECLRKFAKLSMKNSFLEIDNEGKTLKQDYSKLFSLLPNRSSKGDSCISMKEYETLIAICEATSGSMRTKEQVVHLLETIRKLLLELPTTKFCDSIYIKHKAASWQNLSRELTAATIRLSSKFDSFCFETSAQIIIDFCRQMSLEQNKGLTYSFSYLGFLEGLNDESHILCRFMDTFFYQFVLDLNAQVDNSNFLRNAEECFSRVSPADYSRKSTATLQLGASRFIELLCKLNYSIVNALTVHSSDKLLLQILLEMLSQKHDDSTDDDADEFWFSVSSKENQMIGKLSNFAVKYTEFVSEELNVLYYENLKLSSESKSSNLQIIGCSAFLGVLGVDSAFSILKACLLSHEYMLDPTFGSSVFQFGSVLAYNDVRVASYLTRALLSLVSNPSVSQQYCRSTSHSVGLVSKIMSQDAIITTIYALANLLFVGNDDSFRRGSRRSTLLSRRDSFSLKEAPSVPSIRHVVSAIETLKPDGQEKEKGLFLENTKNDYYHVCENIIIAISEIGKACNDENVCTLAVIILSQKFNNLYSGIGRVLLKGLVSLAPYLPEREFIVVVKLLTVTSSEAFEQKNDVLLKDITKARVDLSKFLKKGDPLFKVYLHELLQAIISKGDVQVLEHHRSHNEIINIGDQIGIHLLPLMTLLPDPHVGEDPLDIKDPLTVNLFRNIWFNMVIHGYFLKSKSTNRYRLELEKIAYNTPPLASEPSFDREGVAETSLELNTVLRRGSSNHNIRDHKNVVFEIVPIHRNLSYPNLMFLSATIFVETLRLRFCKFSTILKYLTDSSVKNSGLERAINAIAFKLIRDFISLLISESNKYFGADKIARQLTNILVMCCDRLETSQETAMECCEILIRGVPSSLCHHTSLYSLFDLVGLLFKSILDAEENQYEPTTLFHGEMSGISLLLSDSYEWRNRTLTRFCEKAKFWVKLVLVKSNLDIKTLIQAYISELDKFKLGHKIDFGASFALEMAGSVLLNDKELSSIAQFLSLRLNTIPLLVSQLGWKINFSNDLRDISLKSREDSDNAYNDIRSQFAMVKESVETHDKSLTSDDIIQVLGRCASLILLSDSNLSELLSYVVEIPFIVFEASVMNAAIGIWLALMKDKPSVFITLLAEITKQAILCIKKRKGLYSKVHDIPDSEFNKMLYSPSNHELSKKKAITTAKSFEPHLEITRLFASHFHASLNQSDHILKMFSEYVDYGLKNLSVASLHPFSRIPRFELIKFAFEFLKHYVLLKSNDVARFTNTIFDGILTWFRRRHVYPFGSNALKMRADHSLLSEVFELVIQTPTYKEETIETKKELIIIFMEDEISRIDVWLSPQDSNSSRRSSFSRSLQESHLSKAYLLDPVLAINLEKRFSAKNFSETLQNLISRNPVPALWYPDGVQYLLGVGAKTKEPPHHILFWEPLCPADSIIMFLPPFGSNPYILQYAMRSLEHHDVYNTFFYVPQIVQSLRHDAKGYVERFIIETAKVSQLFAHQIIWNMLANSYKDEDGTEPDTLKPVLDRIKSLMLSTFGGKDLDYYHREFGFFNEVTSISGKLRPFIKKSKAEKKLKIDEEMAKIEIKPDVYLPSNPDGVVVDINRKAGKPLQSHAKAPFMATFKIRKEAEDVTETGDISMVLFEKWQSAIFKVGDDCRQDVLALQLISVFRTIWADAGVNLFLFPYRVTATAPGCGVIDVLPNSTSRDMLGREAVNGLYEYFVSKFGPEISTGFQRARNNFIKSLAAYSIITYLLQFKDRHNGNLMYDDQGHVLHIDFGFCFDIAPGGVKFEAAPFKLTHEMVLVLGGSAHTQAFRWFEELCVKGFLACRPYMEEIIRVVVPMLESGLPCFKESTIRKLRARFVPHKSDREASIFMRSLIRKSMESFYTKGYDEFQRLTNGIPY